MTKWSLILVLVLMLGTIHSAQIVASNQQHLSAAREPSIFVRFDDILSPTVGKEPVKKVFKREVTDDDFTIDDEHNVQNASSEASPVPASDGLKPTADAVVDGVSTENVSSVEELTTEDKEASTGNELDDGKTSNEDIEKTTPENVIATSGEETEKEGTVSTDKKTEVSEVGEGDVDESEEISAENMAVDILPTNGVANNDILGKLMADKEGSADGDLDGEGEEINPFDKMIPVASDTSDNETENPEINVSNDTEETTSIDISIDEDSEESNEPPDEIPIPNPLPKEEDSTAKDFQVDQLIMVTPAASSADDSLAKDSSAAGSSAAGSLPAAELEGSGEGPTDSEASEENESATEKTDAHHVPVGRNFEPTEAVETTTEQPSQTEAIPQGADDSDEGTPLIKGLLPAANEGEKEGINEIGVKIEKETVSEVPNGEAPSSSSGSFIVLGAIMVTIVVLLAYTVVKSRRQKKARRSGNITKAEEEDQGREMKEVDKLLTPKTNGFSPPNGGSKDDESFPLNSFKADFDEAHPIKNGYLPENGGGGLTDVIVENVPRLSTAPKANGNAANENQSEDDHDSWVQGAEKALESTKIKMYIDEDSIPKTPIVIVNRGPTPS